MESVAQICGFMFMPLHIGHLQASFPFGTNPLGKPQRRASRGARDRFSMSRLLSYEWASWTTRDSGATSESTLPARATGPIATAMPVGVAHGTDVAAGHEGVRRKEGRAEGKLIRALNPTEGETSCLARDARPCSSPSSSSPSPERSSRAPQSRLGQSDTSEKAANWREAFSVLHAVAQWSVNLSNMAEKKAKSAQVKGYAHEMAVANRIRTPSSCASPRKKGSTSDR